MAGSFHHRPVLLRESLEHLALQPGQRVVDGTLGGAGHAEAILERIGPDGVLIGLDVDRDALAAAAERLRPFGARARLERASFRSLRDVLSSLAFESVDAVLLDLGVSSHQLDAAARGFRFASDTAGDTPLDMRMDDRMARSAADWLAESSAGELARIFREYGELPGADRLAREICTARRVAPLRTARDLLDVVGSSGVGRGRRHHPATLVFQALRIAVNDEMNALDEGLDAAIESLAPSGRLVVIAYHSLEDRRVKQRLRDEQRGCVCPPRQPVCTCGRTPRLRLVTRRPVRPGDDEIRDNPRARSARLRAAERLPEAC